MAENILLQQQQRVQYTSDEEYTHRSVGDQTFTLNTQGTR